MFGLKLYYGLVWALFFLTLPVGITIVGILWVLFMLAWLGKIQEQIRQAELGTKSPIKHSPWFPGASWQPSNERTWIQNSL